MYTPQRIKPSYDTHKVTTTTPKRTLVQNMTPTVTTPMRVLKSNANVQCCTPPAREPKPPPVLKTPIRVLQNKEEQSHQFTPPGRVLAPPSSITPKRVPVQSRTPRSAMTLNVDASPMLTEHKTPSPSGEGTRNKDSHSKKQADCVDLRTIWKTKKTPLKSPIMKEVLSEVSRYL